MSYARFSKDSDVYIYGADNGIVCCGCSLVPINKDELHYDYILEDWFPDGTFYTTNKYSEMIEHCQKHLDKGDKVPYDTIERLKANALKEGDTYLILDSREPCDECLVTSFHKMSCTKRK